jgi:hypothetical protein
MRGRTRAAVFLTSGVCAWGAACTPALAFNPVKPICSVAGLVSGLVGKACSAVQNGGRFISAGKKLLTGHVGGAVKTALGEGGANIASKATTALALAAVVAWVSGGAKVVLHETATVLDHTTAPKLGTVWFSSIYWRVAGISAVLTLPFLFAAAVQAMVHSDLALLLRAAFGYLPLAMLAVGIAAPLTMLMLAASDQLAAIVSSTAGSESSHFLGRASGLVGALTTFGNSPFLAFFVGLMTVAAAVALWFELLMRAAAVYVIVLMLPLAFAAFVWPARRVWAIRAVEVLVALILSKFAIVAVLSLGGAALSQSAFHNITGMIAGVVLLVMGAFAPWALLRLLPVTEIASSAAGSLRAEGRSSLSGPGPQRAEARAVEGDRWAARTAEMRREAEAADPDMRGGAGRSSVEQLDALQAPSPPAQVQPGQGASSQQPTAEAATTQAQASEMAAPAPAEPARPSAGPSTGESARGERIPGLGAMWQAEDGEWNPLVLGLEGFSQPVWPPHGDGDGTEADPRTADSPDPSPPPQLPQDGRL